MVYDTNICNTRLSLGLGSTTRNDQNHLPRLDHQEIKNKSSPKFDQFFPCLTLGLPSEQTINIDAKGDQSSNIHGQQASSVSAGSSFSNSSVKREREVSGEEVEEERVSPKICEDQDDEGPRKKLRLTKEQSLILEDSFKEHSTLNPFYFFNQKQKQALANRLNLRPRQVEVWFQNRRARTKLKQTEVDCELLKKCCETLKEENRRLQKELQELKAMKLVAPPQLYMQLPAATLTMCPSCERFNGGAGENSTKISFSIGSKPHFYNPFTNHPSAAC